MPTHKCGTCRYYQQSPLRRLGWCRNPKLHDERDRSLVGVNELPCDKSFYDSWEPRTKEPRPEAVAPEGKRQRWTIATGKPKAMVAYSLVATAVVVLIAVAAALGVNGSASSKESTPTVALPTTTPLDTPTPTVQPSIFVRIGNTDGDGAYIRPQPSKLSKGIVAYPDGTRLEIVGDDVQSEGRVWRRVKDAKGNEGWVPAEYLIPEGP